MTARHTGPTGPSKMDSARAGGYYSWLARWRSAAAAQGWALSWPVHGLTRSGPTHSRIRIVPVSADGNDISDEHEGAERQFVRNVKDGERHAVEAMSIIMDVDMPEVLRLMEKWG